VILLRRSGLNINAVQKFSKMSRGLRIVILSRSARTGTALTWGLGQDSKIIEQVLREANVGNGSVRIESIDHHDPITFYGTGRKPCVVDINIHLEVPCRAAWPWARYNIVMVNPEWWIKGAWDWALEPAPKGADMFLFKSNQAQTLFPSLEAGRRRVMTWRCSSDISAALSDLDKSGPQKREFLYLIGSSVNKLAAAKVVCCAWKSAWPRLHIVATRPLLDELAAACEDYSTRGITLEEHYSSDNKRIQAQASYAYHVVASVAEGFGFTFAEAAAVGALPLWTDIPVYNEHWSTVLGPVGKIVSSGAPVISNKYVDGSRTDWSTAAIVDAVESLLKLGAEDERRLRGALRHAYTVRIKEFRHAWRGLLGVVATKLRGAVALPLPPRLPPVADLPHVAVITLTRNRPRWWANMARNILLSDYPPDKMTWIIADDSDGTVGRIDAEVAKFQELHRQYNVKYLSYPKQLHIGAKRNRACEAAPATASVFLMMDDDDHYPKSSIIARVAWLRAMGVGCVYCSVLPMYDCVRYISAINVPPLDLSPAERVSEATLCFTREFWSERKFPGPVSVAEGEGFVADRLGATAEIPPEGVIVSFLHGANATSRRVPDSDTPNGCHFGFDDDYFSYISGLGAVKN
jgi:hypothetical protein